MNDGTDPAASGLLRTATRTDHDAVDAAFGTFDLADRDGYARFLQAHARALAAVEPQLAARAGLPAWRPRLALVLEDLAALSVPEPPAMAFDGPPGAGAAWGMLYVLEGSRLGNAVLVRGLPAGTPARFMQARHLPGEWRALLAAIDAEGTARGAGWVAAAIAGARACFALYRHAA